MPTIDDAIIDVTVAETIDGEVPFTAYFVDQEPIDGAAVFRVKRLEGATACDP